MDIINDIKKKTIEEIKKYIKDNMGRLEDHHLYKKIIIQNNFLIKIQTDDDNKSPKMKFVIYEDKGYSYNDKSEEKTIIHIGGVFMNTASNSKKSDKGRIFINTASNSEDFTKSKNRSFDKKQYYYLDLSKSNKIDNLNSKYLLTLSVLFNCVHLRSFRQEPSKMKCSHYPTPKKKKLDYPEVFQDNLETFLGNNHDKKFYEYDFYYGQSNSQLLKVSNIFNFREINKKLLESKHTFYSTGNILVNEDEDDPPEPPKPPKPPIITPPRVKNKIALLAPPVEFSGRIINHICEFLERRLEDGNLYKDGTASNELRKYIHNFKELREIYKSPDSLTNIGYQHLLKLREDLKDFTIAKLMYLMHKVKAEWSGRGDYAEKIRGRIDDGVSLLGESWSFMIRGIEDIEKKQGVNKLNDLNPYDMSLERLLVFNQIENLWGNDFYTHFTEVPFSELEYSVLKK